VEMTPPAPRSEPLTGPAEPPALKAASAALRAHADQRWVEISDRVVAKAMTATRRSHPIRAQASSGAIQVSEQALICYLRAAIDGTVPGSALAHVNLQVAGGDELSEVTIQLIAQYGTPLLPIADEIRNRAIQCLHEVLGHSATPASATDLHIHFCDVSQGSVEPSSTESQASNRSPDYADLASPVPCSATKPATTWA